MVQLRGGEVGASLPSPSLGRNKEGLGDSRLLCHPSHTIYADRPFLYIIVRLRPAHRHVKAVAAAEMDSPPRQATVCLCVEVKS